MSGLTAPRAYALKGNTISTAAVDISDAGWSWASTDLAQADRAVVVCHTNGVVVSYDGTTPTASLGIPVAAGATLEVKGNANILNLQLIRSSGSDAAVSVQLEKY